MNKAEIELLSFPFDENDISNLQYALSVLVERHELDEWEYVGEKEENSSQYGALVYLLCDLLGPDTPCKDVDPLLADRYYWHCLDKRQRCDETLTRAQVLVKFRDFN